MGLSTQVSVSRDLPTQRLFLHAVQQTGTWDDLKSTNYAVRWTALKKVDLAMGRKTGTAKTVMDYVKRRLNYETKKPDDKKTWPLYHDFNNLSPSPSTAVVLRDPCPTPESQTSLFMEVDQKGRLRNEIERIILEKASQLTDVVEFMSFVRGVRNLVWANLSRRNFLYEKSRNAAPMDRSQQVQLSYMALERVFDSITLPTTLATFVGDYLRTVDELELWPFKGDLQKLVKNSENPYVFSWCRLQ